MNRFLLAFVAIAALVIGGLAHATLAALRLEAEQKQSAIKAELTEKIRLALWRLDSRLAPTLAREDSRPSAHYTVLHAPLLAMKNTGATWTGGQVWLPSPLLNAELPPWMALHFQIDPAAGWQSPQVITAELADVLCRVHGEIKLTNVTPERKAMLAALAKRFPPPEAVATCSAWGVVVPEGFPEWTPAPAQQPANARSNFEQRGGIYSQNSVQLPMEQGNERDFNIRQQFQDRSRAEGKATFGNDARNYPNAIVQNAKELFAIEPPVEIRLGDMKPVWLGKTDDSAEFLLFVRVAQVGPKPLYQGVVLDWPRVREELLAGVTDLFPEASLRPLPDGTPSTPDRAMTALPIELDPGTQPEPPATGWSALRIGLGFAWAAAFVALTAVGLGGWTLIDLSERRIRFVSAVTHELRTPLTTLRLYLDLLTSGMVRDEKHRDEYLATLHGEADRLHRLIGNVLDFARLEKSRPVARCDVVVVAELLEQVRSTWAERCAADGKELVVEDHLPPAATVSTDAGLVQQVVGNLVDNARKYTREAADVRVWVRAGRCENGKIYVEVEDRGPGIGAGEKASVFRAFCRGRDADVTAGGVGLGLALARRWALLLGGRLMLEKGEAGVGARFRLEIPG